MTGIKTLLLLAVKSFIVQAPDVRLVLFFFVIFWRKKSCFFQKIIKDAKFFLVQGSSYDFFIFYFDEMKMFWKFYFLTACIFKIGFSRKKKLDESGLFFLFLFYFILFFILPKLFLFRQDKRSKMGRHDTQHNDTQYNDTQNNKLSIMTLSIMILRI